jgi:hypothetical protein
VRTCPDDIARKSLCYARIVPGSGKIEYETLTVNDSEKGNNISLEVFQKPSVRFSKNNHVLIFDSSGESDFFFDVDLGAMVAKKIIYKEPEGQTIMPHSFQCGPNGNSYAIVYDGSVWVKLPDVEQPFPVANGFFVYNPAVWLP